MKGPVKKLIVGGIVCLFFLGMVNTSANPSKPQDIVEKGLAYYQSVRAKHDVDTAQQLLETWFLKQPSVKKVETVNKDMTVEFTDGHKVVILGHTEERPTPTWSKPDKPGKPGNPGGGKPPKTKPATYTPNSNDAILLDPFGWQGGVFNNPDLFISIKSSLLLSAYSNTMYKDDEVTVSLLQTGLAGKGVIYNRGHGGTSGRTVIICTGEAWTSGTPLEYLEDYSNERIIKVYISHNGQYWPFIAYTPKFIEYYYCNNLLSDSLVYMETCSGMKSTTMAKAYVTAGAEAYMGWTNDVTVVHGDGSADISFSMFANGKSTSEVAAAISKDPWTGARFKYYGAADLGLILLS